MMLAWLRNKETVYENIKKFEIRASEKYDKSKHGQL